MTEHDTALAEALAEAPTEAPAEAPESETPPASQDAFWSYMEFVLNEEFAENGFEFINSVTVADDFLRFTNVAARLNARAEEVTAQLGKLEEDRDTVADQIRQLRRLILADNWSGVRTTFNAELLDSYVLASAPEGQKQEIVRLETKLRAMNAALKRGQIVSDKYKNRVRFVERRQDWAKQWLDHDKLQQKVNLGGRL